jgi:hypothetical protein
MNEGIYDDERAIEEKFSDVLDMSLGWHAFEGRLKRQVPVPVGHETKKADIVLYAADGKPFVIEMKGVSVIPRRHEIEQLKSYMKILASEYGMIANDREMRLYFCAHESTRMEEYARIPYEMDNVDGAEFASIMTFPEHSWSKLEKFRDKKLDERKEKQLSEELKKELCDESEGKRLLVQALLACNEVASKYTERVILAAVNDIAIKPKKEVPPPIERSREFNFTRKGLQPGEVIVFKGDSKYTATVAGYKTVKFEGNEYKLSTLAKLLYKRIDRLTPSGAYQGAAHFLYNGTLLVNLPDVQ